MKRMYIIILSICAFLGILTLGIFLEINSNIPNQMSDSSIMGLCYVSIFILGFIICCVAYWAWPLTNAGIKQSKEQDVIYENGSSKHEGDDLEFAGLQNGANAIGREPAKISHEIIISPQIHPDQSISMAPISESLRYIIEEIFVIYNDGRLILDCARQGCTIEDADLMSGMLIAIQGFLQDGLKRGGRLDSIRYGDNLVLISNGEYVNVAVVLYGQPDDELKELLEDAIRKIEGTYAGIIENWNGDLSVLAGIYGFIAPILERTAHLNRNDIGGTPITKEVSLLSAIDFYRGYVRLKVAAVNSTDELLADTSIEVEYNPNMLRLERIDPGLMKLRGDRASLGNIKPGERTTIAFFFDPQICQETFIDGSLTYFDHKGIRHRVDMKRRQADVVCPIFFTKENANTAMLRRLIHEKLNLSDLRTFRYPKAISPMEILVLGKLAIGSNNIQMVREYVVKGPPYEAEVWYYGETKVKGFQIVIRLSVVEERQILEFFVASTAMEPITGLIADFRRELDRVLKEKYTGEGHIEFDRDEKLKSALERRPLLIDRVGEGEIEAGEVT